MKVCNVQGFFIALLAVVLVSDGFAQTQPSVDIRGIRGRKVKTPNYGISLPGGGSAKTKNWFRVEVEYDTDRPWIDELTFTYYALLKGGSDTRSASQGGYRLLTTDITYVNIAEGRRHESVVFVDPATQDRYGDVQAVALVVKSNGVTVGVATDPKTRTKWWEQYPPQGQLLNRLQTPFAYYNYDNYEMIKVSDTGR